MSSSDDYDVNSMLEIKVSEGVVTHSGRKQMLDFLFLD